MDEKEADKQITEITKPMSQPTEEVNVIVTPRDGSVPEVTQHIPMSWWMQMLVRGARSYVQNVLGYLLGAALGTSVAYAADQVLPVMPVRDFSILFLAALSTSIGPTVVCLLQNALEILTTLDAKMPRLRA